MAKVADYNDLTIPTKTDLLYIEQAGSSANIPAYEFAKWFRDGGNVITVGTQGADYTTIQGAINSISGNSSTNQFIILVYPGIYSETVAMTKSYCSLVSLVPQRATITSTGSSVATLTSNATISGFKITGNGTNTGVSLVVGTQTGHILENCILDNLTNGVLIPQLVTSADIVYNTFNANVTNAYVFSGVLTSTVRLGFNKYLNSNPQPTSPTKTLQNIENLNTIRTITATDNQRLLDDFILADATAGNIIIYLRSATLLPNKTLTIKKIDITANTVTIDPNGSQTIDGSLTKVLTSQWDSVTIANNGSNWFIK